METVPESSALYSGGGGGEVDSQSLVPTGPKATREPVPGGRGVLLQPGAGGGQPAPGARSRAAGGAATRRDPSLLF